MEASNEEDFVAHNCHLDLSLKKGFTYRFDPSNLLGYFIECSDGQNLYVSFLEKQAYLRRSILTCKNQRETDRTRLFRLKSTKRSIDRGASVVKRILGELNLFFDETCAYCADDSIAMYVCGRCYFVNYCSPACQEADWRSHRRTACKAEYGATDSYRMWVCVEADAHKIQRAVMSVVETEKNQNEESENRDPDPLILATDAIAAN